MSKGAYEAILLDWKGDYPDPEAYLTPLLSCQKVSKNICEKGEALFSGSFWGNTEVQNKLDKSESLNGEKRLKKLIEVENIAAKEFAYIPIWILKSRAWSQQYISVPNFNGNGFIQIELLEKIN